MAVRGAKPKPVALRLLNGNAGKRPVNEQEPRLPVCPLDSPDWLSIAAQTHWKRLAPMLANAGVLKQSDADLLATYCETFAAYVEAVGNGGASMPMIGQLRQLMGELGMTPSARARIIADKVPEDDETKTRFFVV